MARKRIDPPNTHDSGTGIACPKCGCCALKVLRTTRLKRYIQRRRQCRYCHTQFSTFERTALIGDSE